MRWWLLVLTACGRIGFDPLGHGGDGATGGDDDDDEPGIDAGLVPPGPAVWLRMETDPNAMIVDSGGGHAVACTGPICPAAVAGKRGQGYRFTGSQVDVAPAADLDPSAGFTAAIWIDLQTLPGSVACCPWNKSFDNANGRDTFALCIDSTGAVVFDAETPGGTTISETSEPIATGEWHHLAVTWDGATQRDYLDGVAIGGGSFPIGAGDEGLALGGSRGDYFFDGIVDEALYYTRALSAAEIQQLAAP